MTCTGVGGMKVKELVKQVIFPIVAVVILIVLFYPLCLDNGECDYLKLWILVGIPFGVHRMFFWLIPKGFDIGGTVGLLVFNLLIGGVIGSVVLIWHLFKAAFYLIKYIGSTGVHIVKKVGRI